jgi:hypothetical protein
MRNRLKPQQFDPITAFGAIAARLERPFYAVEISGEFIEWETQIASRRDA